MPKTLKACRNCKGLTYGRECPICKSTNLTTNWKGYIRIISPEKSEVAKILEINIKGRFALNIV